ncbi:MAG: hypothetical protein PWQ96_1497 [Clostridia bacterium]|jgi:hypothetical protein|nr:hypothetical protein [Clostridiales bacterium]MDK2985855.1 hypothetical protein [Clostridia bacterium]
MSKNNGIDPEIIDNLKNVLKKGDMAQNISKIAEMLSEPKQSEAVKKILTSKALEKIQEKNQVANEMLNLDPRLNLLLAIKPFLSEHRAQKVDKVVKSMSLGSLFKDLNKLV